jgi:hypothetical protein
MDKIERLASNSIKPVRKVETNEYMYCVSPGYAINPNGNYSKIVNSPWQTLGVSKKTYERMQLISYYGYQYKNHTDLKWYGVTKYLVWLEVMPQGWSVYLTETLRGEETHKFDYMINEINNLINNYYKNPNIKTNIIGNYKNTIIINDTNNVLENYTSNKSNVKIEGNTLIINPSDTSFDFKLSYKTDGKSSVLYTFDDAQWLISRGNPPNKSITYHVEIPKGSLSINKSISNLDKLSYNANISPKNASYRVFNDNYNEIYETDENGQININNLNVDDYYIKEVSAPYGLKLDPNTYQVSIKANEKTSTNLYDEVIIGSININKKYLDTDTNNYLPEENACFGVIDNNKNLLVTKNTNELGYVSFKLPLGNYIISQLKGIENYKTVKDEEIEVIDELPINLEYKNMPITQITTTESNLVIKNDPIDQIVINESINEEEYSLPISNTINNKNQPKNLEINPQTSDNIMIYLLILIVGIIINITIIYKNIKKNKGNWQKKGNI